MTTKQNTGKPKGGATKRAADKGIAVDRPVATNTEPETVTQARSHAGQEGTENASEQPVESAEGRTGTVDTEAHEGGATGALYQRTQAQDTVAKLGEGETSTEAEDRAQDEKREVSDAVPDAEVAEAPGSNTAYQGSIPETAEAPLPSLSSAAHQLDKVLPEGSTLEKRGGVVIFSANSGGGAPRRYVGATVAEVFKDYEHELEHGPRTILDQQDSEAVKLQLQRETSKAQQQDEFRRLKYEQR
jgi:hypothetical protein